MKRKISEFRSDEEAAAFLEQDLSDLDFARFKPAHFEIAAKAAPPGRHRRVNRSPTPPPARPRTR
jgi:predicted DNA binding CopG/RHH family protein